MSRYAVTISALAFTAVAPAVMCADDVSAQVGRSGPTTFHRDVLPILQRNCQTCHRPDQIAPMSFLSYEATRPWARAIKTAVVSKKNFPSYGVVVDDLSLSQRDVVKSGGFVAGTGDAGRQDRN